MKYHIILSFLLSSFMLNAQSPFSIQLRADTTLCAQDSLYPGKNLVIENGMLPYSYAWETVYRVGSSTHSSEYFLDSITIANPLFQNKLDNKEQIILKLTVTDKNENIATDSMIITSSKFSYTLADVRSTIMQGDSVELLTTVGGGISPLQHEWSPNYQLSSSSIQNPWAKPDTTTFYKCVITDATGCKTEMSDIHEVYVDTRTSLDEKEGANQVEIYPNPTSGLIMMSGENIQAIELRGIDGNILMQKYGLVNDHYQLNVSEYNAGTYSLRCLAEDRWFMKKVVIVH